MGPCDSCGLWILLQQKREKQETARQSRKNEGQGGEEGEEEAGARILHLVATGPYVHSQNELAEAE